MFIVVKGLLPTRIIAQHYPWVIKMLSMAGCGGRNKAPF